MASARGAAMRARAKAIAIGARAEVGDRRIGNMRGVSLLGRGGGATLTPRRAGFVWSEGSGDLSVPETGRFSAVLPRRPPPLHPGRGEDPDIPARRFLHVPNPSNESGPGSITFHEGIGIVRTDNSPKNVTPRVGDGRIGPEIDPATTKDDDATVDGIHADRRPDWGLDDRFHVISDKGSHDIDARGVGHALARRPEVGRRRRGAAPLGALFRPPGPPGATGGSGAVAARPRTRRTRRSSAFDSFCRGAAGPVSPARRPG